jgi:FkbM family methyltransferase
VIEREPAFKWVLRQELQELKHIAIEPDPTTFQTLKLNMEFNEVSGACSRYAVADVCGEATFYSAAKNNLGSLIERCGFSKTEMTVPCLTIPGVLEDHGLDRVDLIKMDIEGGEVLALRGARDFFENGAAPKILMEIHQLQYTKALSLEEELKFLFSSGWTCHYMISTAVPGFYSGYHECLPVRSFEVKPGWKRIIFYAPSNDNVLRYACWEDKIGVPTWHGTLSGKLIRALLLRKCD